MQLVELSLADKELYNRFVKNNEAGSFLQSWEWGEWQASLGREALRFFVIDDYQGGNLASIQLIKMPLPFGRYYLYAPYGPVLAGGENFQFPIFNFQLLLRELKKKFSEAIFIRIEPKETYNLQLTTYNLPIVKSANIQPGKTLLIDLTKSADDLLVEMHPKTRYNIKIAQKRGVEIKDEFDISVGHGLFFDEALKLIMQTSKRQKFTTFPPEYYKKMVDFFALGSGEVRLHVYKAVLNDQLLSGAIMIDFGKTRTFLFGGSSENNKNVMAPYLLHWQAMQDAAAQGFKIYDFWGIETASGDVPGFVRFKLGFGGREQIYAGAYDYIISKSRYRTYRILRAANKMAKKISLG